jgi:branched-chain amino acid aminotransferase
LRIVNASPDFILIFRPLKSSGKEGVKIKISRIRKIPPESIDPRIKAIGQIDKILARLELSEDEYEAIMLSYNGYLAEGTMSNIFIVSNDRLITPSFETGILSGITRDVVIEIARKKSIEVEERFVELSELFNADEVFLTHTSAEIVPVRYVEKIEKKIGPITSILKAEFREYINEWLSNKNPG